MYSLIRPLLFRLEPETAHRVALGMARIAGPLGLINWMRGRIPALPRQVMGIDFPNPVGLAAGFDKDGKYLTAMARMGFGFIELGTVTPRPQPGNPRPRLFRIPEAEALINRMGFNNVGAAALARRLRTSGYRGVVGINIGKNRDTPPERAADDYAAALDAVYGVADYVAVNVSSPNTPGLRALQQASNLRTIVYRLQAERRRLSAANERYVPLVVKIAPDWEPGELEPIIEQLLELEVDGIAATNTTLSRPGLEGVPTAEEEGGLSGRPLKPAAEEVLRGLARQCRGKTALIGVGGISTGDDARERMEAGADLVQLYTGLVYRGPRLVGEAIRAAGDARPCSGAWRAAH